MNIKNIVLHFLFLYYKLLFSAISSRFVINRSFLDLFSIISISQDCLTLKYEIFPLYIQIFYLKNQRSVVFLFHDPLLDKEVLRIVFQGQSVSVPVFCHPYSAEAHLCERLSVWVLKKDKPYLDCATVLFEISLVDNKVVIHLPFCLDLKWLSIHLK
jgi:hypothetical protein